MPTPRGLRLVGVGAYSTVDSRAARVPESSPAPAASSSRNFTLRDPETDPFSFSSAPFADPEPVAPPDVPKMSSPARLKIPAPELCAEEDRDAFFARELDLRRALPPGTGRGRPEPGTAGGFPDIPSAFRDEDVFVAATLFSRGVDAALTNLSASSTDASERRGTDGGLQLVFLFSVTPSVVNDSRLWSASAAASVRAACSHAAAARASAPEASRGVQSPERSRASCLFRWRARTVLGVAANGSSASSSELWSRLSRRPSSGTANTECSSVMSIASAGDTGDAEDIAGKPRVTAEIHRSRSSTVPARSSRREYPCVLQHNPYRRCQ